MNYEQGTATGPRLPITVQERVEALYLDGVSMCQIAAQMTAQQVPTATGCSTWYAATVRSVLSSRANDRLAGLL